MTGAQPATHRYGTQPSQFGHLSLPASSPPHPVVVLLHGGFWRRPWGLDLMSGVARDLAGAGVAVWNLEYRRVGQRGGGWPGTLADVAAGIDALATAADRLSLDLTGVVVVGHSAGGQLALWSAARRPSLPGVPSRPVSVRPAAVVSLAGVCDLEAAAAAGLGRDAVAQFLGGRVAAVPARYRRASPHHLVPLGVPQVLVHGDRDAKVPPGQSRSYAQCARVSGDDVQLVEVAGGDHMQMLDPFHTRHALRLLRSRAALG